MTVQQGPSSDQPSDQVSVPSTPQNGTDGISPRAIRWTMAAVAVVAIIIGLSLGMAPSSISTSAGSGDTVPCGSPWSPDASDAEMRDDFATAIGREYGYSIDRGYADKCEKAHGARGGWGTALAGLGALTLLGLGLIAAAGGSTQRTTPTS